MQGLEHRSEGRGPGIARIRRKLNKSDQPILAIPSLERRMAAAAVTTASVHARLQTCISQRHSETSRCDVRTRARHPCPIGAARHRPAVGPAAPSSSGIATMMVLSTDVGRDPMRPIVRASGIPRGAPRDRARQRGENFLGRFRSRCTAGPPTSEKPVSETTASTALRPSFIEDHVRSPAADRDRWRRPDKLAALSPRTLKSRRHNADFRPAVPKRGGKKIPTVPRSPDNSGDRSAASAMRPLRRG